MSFAKRLETLLEIYRVSNAALARELGVDASLVSRWKTGNRLPPPIHHTAREIAEFLAGLPLRSHDKAFLLEVLGPGAQTVMPVDAMEKYLLDIPLAPVGETAQAEQETLLSGLCALLQQDGASTLRGPVNLWPRVQKGQPMEHEAFFGVEGKRQAAINFLYTALSGNRRTEMYLLLPEDSAWISGSFATLFYHALYAFAQRGGVIRVIHKRPADTHEMFSGLSALLPHYLTGRVFSYSLTGRHHPPAPTLFVASGLCATVTQQESPDEMTALYRTASDTARLERLFQEYLRDAPALARACDSGDPLAQQTALFELERQPGDCYVAIRDLNPLWAPEPLLQKAQVPGAMSLLARRRECVLSHQAHWVEIWPEELLDGWFAARKAVAQNKRQVIARLEAVLDGVGKAVETA